MTRDPVPAHARVVIIGGGIVGCSTAYHLAKLGCADVVLLEQGRISCGTTWHAAGLVGQLRAQESMTRLVRYSTQLYAGLEQETGLASGWKNCGSLTVARTAARMTQLRRTAAIARAYGVDCDVVSPAQAHRHWPLMRTDDLVGAVWLPGDGKCNPSDLTQALARGARSRGVRIIEGMRVTGVSVQAGAVAGVRWCDKMGGEGEVVCETVVNCAGQWAKAVGRLCGVTIPLHSAEHFYLVTERLDGAHPDLPVMRDPDGYVYFKEEVGGLVMGGFEPDAKPWGMDGIPEPFEFQLLPEDWEQFEILMRNAIHRVPMLADCGVKQLLNGPESFTPDNNFLLGEAPELRNFYVGAAFNSMGIASAGGAGMALAEWIVAGEPTMDLWPVDIRRFARFNGNDRWLRKRVKETLGLHYAMPWPNRELDSARPLRRSPLYSQLAAAGACFGSRMGWERANWFGAPGSRPSNEYSFGRQNWFAASAQEHLAARRDVALFDMTSFSKFLVKGRDAQDVLQYLAANDVAVPVGRTVYTALLNDRGGFESDLTATRLADDEYLLVSGSAQATRDAHYIERHIPAGRHCVLIDITGMISVLAVMGPRSRELLSSVSRADFGNAAFAFGSSREIDIGYATVRATRITYVGELGWELYVPVEQTVSVFETLSEAGRSFGLVNAGYYAIESLRLEKAYRAWGRELTPDYTPVEAGLLFAVRCDKGVAFRGREVIEQQVAAGVSRRLAAFTLEDPQAVIWGGELIIRDGRPAGHLTSGAYGHSLGRSVALGYVSGEDRLLTVEQLAGGRYEIEIAGIRVPATVHVRAPLDPRGVRIRS